MSASNFQTAYVRSNLRADVPDYDETFIDTLREHLVASDQELKPIGEAILTSLVIGAHRPDLVPHLLRRSLLEVEGIVAAQRQVLDRFRAVLMVVWPFVGIPWCVPACLAIVEELRHPQFEHLLAYAEGSQRPELDVKRNQEAGLQLMERTYETVNNSEVRDILRTYWADFSSLTWTVVFGYSLGGTTAAGIFEEAQTQLVLATAIAGSGATRQARSHLIAAVGLGISMATAMAISDVSVKLNEWNGVTVVPPLPPQEQ